MGLLISIIEVAAGIGVLIGSLLAAIYAYDAWQGIPRELYLLEGPHAGIFRPSHFLGVAVVVSLIVRIGEWSGLFKVSEMVARSGHLLCFLFLAWWFVWAVRIARQRPAGGRELVRFAKYVCRGTGIFIITILTSILVPRR